MQRNYTALLGKTLAYAETWWQNPGYGNLIIHPCWNTTNLHFTGLHTATNASAVLGFLELYKKFRSERWLQRSIECADVLVSLAKADGIFRNSTAEGDPEEGTLISNAIPDIALLRLAEVLQEGDQDRASRYIHVAQKNIEWFIERWWNGRRFCGTINQDLLACIAMALYLRLTGREPSRLEKYSDYILKVIDYIEEMVQTEEPIKGAIQRSEESGGRIFATSYQAAKALFLLELSREFEDARLVPIAKGAAQYVSLQQRPDGFFTWGYLEKDGRIVKKELPLVYSVGILECGYEFERLGVRMNWQKYLGLILEEIPMKLAAKGFGGHDQRDWRNGVPSASNINLIRQLAKLIAEEPPIIPFNDIIVSEGTDVLAGSGSYVYLETKENVYRIKDDSNPALDYVLSKKAELPTAFPTLDGGPSFCVFEQGKDEKWDRQCVNSKKGEVTYTTGKQNRKFQIVDGSLVINQSPYDSGEIYFEVLPRQSLFYELQAEKNGQLISIPFTCSDGRKETVLTELGNWFIISNWSPRLKNGNVKVSFSSDLHRLRIDHTAANPYGKLRVWASCAPQEKLAVKIETL